MKRAALVLAAGCLFLAACDPDHQDRDWTPAAPAQAPTVLEGPPNPQPPPIAPAGNSAPSLSLRTTDKSGPAPHTITVRMCESSDADQDNINYKYLWGDGTREYYEHGSGAFCSRTHRYFRPGRYRAIFCVDDGWSSHEVCDDFFVNVQ